MTMPTAGFRGASDPATVLSGSGPPTDDIGSDGDTYVDVDSNLTYGPKAAGVWPVGAVVELARA